MNTGAKESGMLDNHGIVSGSVWLSGGDGEDSVEIACFFHRTQAQTELLALATTVDQKAKAACALWIINNSIR